MAVLLEACLDSLSLAKAAEQGGAGRIELCDRLDIGGTTPSESLICSVLDAVWIPVFPIIRPRGGDLVYSGTEVDSMKHDVEMVRRAGANGIVLGILNPDNTIDTKRTRDVMDIAPDLPATFHMAFDTVPDQIAALETLISIGVTRVLTKGGAAKASDAIDRLHSLVERAGERIVILAGGGVREDNVAAIVRGSGVREVHSRGTNVRDIVANANLVDGAVTA